MSLPVAFLPFDPHQHYKDSDDSSFSQTDDDDDESSENRSVGNDDEHFEQKQAEHIGGGVLLVKNLSGLPKETLYLLFYFIGFSKRMYSCRYVSRSNKENHQQTTK